MNIIPRWLVISIFLVGFIGFLDASYLSSNAYFHTVPPCIITSGCEVVTTSTYSKIFGLPVAYMGTLYYLTCLTLWFVFINKKKIWAARLLPIVVTTGFLFSLWFVLVQAFILKAFCTYCMLSAGTSTILFVLSLIVWRKLKTHEQTELSA